MTRALLVGICGVLLSTAFVPPQPPAAVSVYVRCATPNGKPVRGITKDDLQLTEDGQPRAIASVSPASDPLALVVLLDLTRGSWSSKNDGELDAAIGVELKRRLPAVDYATVASVTRRITIASVLSNDRRDFAASLHAALAPPDGERYGNSPIWDGVNRAIDLLAATRVGDGGMGPLHRAVIVFTDGEATGNVARLEDVIARAQAARVSVNVLFNPQRREPLVQDTSPELVVLHPELGVQQLATDTGGSFTRTNARDGTTLGGIFASLVEDLRKEYTLAFVPAAFDGKSHRVILKAGRIDVLTFAQAFVVVPERK